MKILFNKFASPDLKQFMASKNSETISAAIDALLSNKKLTAGKILVTFDGDKANASLPVIPVTGKKNAFTPPKGEFVIGHYHRKDNCFSLEGFGTADGTSSATKTKAPATKKPAKKSAPKTKGN